MKLTKALIAEDVIEEILASPIPYQNEEQQKLAEDLLGTIAVEDFETLAEASYAYWVKNRTESMPSPTEEQTRRMALRECRRHIVGVTYESAVNNIQETIAYRRGRRLDLYRACFADGAEFDADEQVLVDKLRQAITTEQAKQTSYVRGMDRDMRGLLTIHARTDSTTDDDEFITNLIYVCERATAVTEILSRGKEEKMLVVLDFGEFQRALSPPLSAFKGITAILQTRFSERLKNNVILDPPFWMRTIYSVIKPFLHADTRAKFVIVAGEKQKHEALEGRISIENATPLLLPGGKLVGEVDVECFLKKVPFHLPYDMGC